MVRHTDSYDAGLFRLECHKLDTAAASLGNLPVTKGTGALSRRSEDIQLHELSQHSEDWDKNFLMIADVNMIADTFTTALIGN